MGFREAVAVAGATALPNQGRQTSGGDGDAHTGGVGDAPARLLISADRAFGLGDAADRDGLLLPAVESKDPVGLSHRKPPLDIGDLPAALLPLADVGAIEWGGERRELLGGEAGRRSLGGFLWW